LAKNSSSKRINFIFESYSTDVMEIFGKTIRLKTFFPFKISWDFNYQKSISSRLWLLKFKISRSLFCSLKSEQPTAIFVVIETRIIWISRNLGVSSHFLLIDWSHNLSIVQPPIIMIFFSIKTLFNTRNDSQKLRRGSLDSRSYIY